MSVVLEICRHRAVKELVKRHGLTEADAERRVYSLDDSDIVARAKKEYGLSSSSADTILGDLENVWQWILAHETVILQIISAIISLVLMLGGQSKAARPMPLLVADLIGADGTIDSYLFNAFITTLIQRCTQAAFTPTSADCGAVAQAAVGFLTRLQS